MRSTDTQSSQADARNTRDTRINVRTNTRQDSLIRRAAEASHKSVTEFVLESATVAAEHILADRRWFQLDDGAWATFEAVLERPTVFKPRLSESLANNDPFAR